MADKTLRCDVCPYRTNKLGLLTIHKTYHRPQAKNTYKCPYCPYYVCASRLLHQHIRIHIDAVQPTSHSDVRCGNGGGPCRDQATTTMKRGEATSTAAALRCSICPYVGRSKNDVIYHRQFHRARPTAPYRCRRCPFWVGEKRMLAQHDKVHRAEPDRRRADLTQSSTVVTDGGQNGDRKRSRNDDRSAAHDDGSKNLPSSGCSGSIIKSTGPHDRKASGTDLDVNGGKSDNDVRRCGGSSAGDDGRRRRVARTLWHCDRCPYVTAKRSQHETHRRLHGSRQRHTCRLCDYSVGGLHLLMQHVRLHHRDPTAEASRGADGGGGTQSTKEDPPRDGQTNSSNSSSSSSKEVRPLFRCDRCPYSNARRDHLLCHARFHASDGPLRCPQCDYCVSKVHLLTQHLRVHQLSPPDAAQNSSAKAGAAKDQFMRSLSLTTK